MTGLIKNLITGLEIQYSNSSHRFTKYIKKLVKHVRKYANNHCVTKGKNLSKLRYLFTHKQEIMKEKYMSKVSRSKASTIFKLCARMNHLKNSFRNIYYTMQKRTRCGRTFIWKVRKDKELKHKMQYSVI